MGCREMLETGSDHSSGDGGGVPPGAVPSTCLGPTCLHREPAPQVQHLGLLQLHICTADPKPPLLTHYLLVQG